MTNRQLLEKVAGDVSQIKTEIVLINDKLEVHDKRFDQLDKKFTELFDFLDQDVQKMKQKLRKVAGKNI
ncbi:MAG: hypothetical protein ACI4DK_16810 [Lachnospiraceae bacterium]